MTRTRTTRTPRGQHARRLPACGHAGSRRAAAFSLMEVLIALGIFALGLVAVAAVFPTAIAIQSETVRDLAGQRAVINARATIQALARSTEPAASNKFLTLTFKKTVNPITLAATYSGTLASYGDSVIPPTGRTGFPGGVQPMIDQPLPPTSPVNAQLTFPPFGEMSINSTPLNAPKSFHNLFSEDIRSYPKNIAATDKRDYYWYPFIQANDLTGATSTWMVYLMVMQRHGTEAVPEARAVKFRGLGASNKELLIQATNDGSAYWLDNDADNDGLPDVIQPGDYLLGDEGSIFRVVVAQRDRITIDSQLPVGAGLNLLYYAVARDGLDGTIKRESRSAIVRIEQFQIVVNEP